MTAGGGGRPHFFRQHRLEKNAGLTPTLAVTSRILEETHFFTFGMDNAF